MKPRILLYELVMAALAVTSIGLALLPDSGWAHVTSITIWLIFLFDYVVRFVRAKDRPKFARQNIPELLSVLPWDILRGLRLLRLLRLMRLLRGFGLLWRAHRVAQGVLETNGLGYVLVATAVIVVMGGVIVREVEPGITSIGDGVWWSLVTTTTVGYGDIAPRTLGGRIVAGILMLVGIGTIGMITAGIATYFLGARKTSNPHVQHIQRQLDQWEKLSPAERRDIARLLEALTREE